MPLTREETVEMNQLSMEIEEVDIDRQIAELESRATGITIPDIQLRPPVPVAATTGVSPTIGQPEPQSFLSQLSGDIDKFALSKPSQHQELGTVINLIKEIVRLPEMLDPIAKPIGEIAKGAVGRQESDPMDNLLELLKGTGQTAEGLARFFPDVARNIINVTGAGIPTPPLIGEQPTEEAFRRPTGKEAEQALTDQPLGVVAGALGLGRIGKAKPVEPPKPSRLFKKEVPLAEVSKGAVKATRPEVLAEKPPEAPKPVSKPIPKVPEVTKAAPVVKKPVLTATKEFKKSGDIVDGRQVRGSVPNTESISASFNAGESKTLPGIREIKMSDIETTKPRELFYAADDLRRVRKLTEEIKQSKEISPLIVVQDAEGLYILEGAHRLGALNEVGAKSFPALVVQDLKSLAELKPKPAPIVPKAEKVAPVAPIKAPEVVKPTPEPLDAVALKKETITQIRKDFELDKLTKPERKGFEQSAKEAVETKAVDNALLTSEEVIKSKRAVSDVEHAGMTIKATELMNEYDAVLADIGKQADKGNTQGVKFGQKRAEAVLSQIETITKAADFAGTEAGRTLSIRRAFINRNDFSVARLKIQAKATKGKPLDAKQNKTIEDFAIKNKELEKKVADLQQKYAKDLDNEAAVLAERIHQRELRKTRITVKTTKAKKKIKSDIEGIKSQIRELGIRVNEATGLGPEAAFLVGRLAVKYSNSGIQTLKGVVQKVLQDIPSIAERDVIRSINAKNPKLQKKAKTQAQRNTQLLKREARLIVDLEAAEQGLFKRLPKKGEVALGVRAETLRNIKVMQSKIRALKANFNRTISDGKRLQRAFDTVNQLQDQLSGLFREVKAKKAPDPIFIKAMKEKAVELRKLMRTQDEIANLGEQLRTGDFIIREKQTLKRQPQDLERAQVELNILRKKVRRSIEDLAPPTAGKITQETINTLRTFKATADASYLMRQGFWLSARRPVLALKSFGKSLEATFSELKAEGIDNALRQAPHHYIRELAGLELTEIGGRIRAGEESFMSKFAERIPGYGRIVKASERNMTTGLNMIRAGVFDEFISKFPNATLQEMKAYADYINKASGRGNLGRFANAGNILGSIFFAPRFAASRFQTPFALVKNWRNPRIRKEIAKDMAAVGGVGITVLTLADLAGADVTFDFDSADFLKVKIGNTRIDFGAGFQQPLRLLMQIGASPFKAKIEWGKAPLDLISRFTQYKTSPGITLPLELATGRTIIGQPTTVSESLARAVVPLAFQDILDAYKAGGIDRAALSTGLEFFGVGVNTYNRATKRRK